MHFPSIIQSILKGKFNFEQRSQHIKPGQIFYGKVNRLFPHQLGEIQFGTNKLVAKIEVPLIRGNGYWFQVLSTENGITLKIIDEHTPKTTEEPLIQHLGIKNNKSTRAFIQFLLKEQYPMTRNEMISGAELIAKLENPEMGLQVFKLLKLKKIPFTVEIFHSLLALEQDQTTVQLIVKLKELLEAEQGLSFSGKKLLKLLEGIMTPSEKVPDMTVSKTVLTNFVQTLYEIGQDYEGILNKGTKVSDSIKLFLVRLIQEGTEPLSNKTKEIAHQLLSRLNGLQLVSTDTNQVQTILFEIPIQLNGQMKELTMQWSGRKNQDGKIDPDFCHILFYLNLENLNHTIVDMNVQNRIIHVTLYNENPEIKNLAEHLIPKLKSSLIDQDYHLSGVFFKQFDLGKVQPIGVKNQSSMEGGLDIRI